MRALDPYNKGINLTSAQIAKDLSTEESQMHRSTVSRALKSLEKKGFLEMELLQVHIKVNSHHSRNQEMEFVVRRRLQESGESLRGLYPGNPKKATQRPTAEKLLAAFKHLTLTLFRVKGEWYGDVTELNPLQRQILLCLGLSPDIYSGLVENST